MDLVYGLVYTDEPSTDDAPCSENDHALLTSSVNVNKQKKTALQFYQDLDFYPPIGAFKKTLHSSGIVIKN